MNFALRLFVIFCLSIFVSACGDDVGNDETTPAAPAPSESSDDGHDEDGHDEDGHDGHDHDAHSGEEEGHDDHSGHGHDDHHGHDHDPNEVMTTVNLTFTPAGGGEPVTAGWADPEADGSPVIDPITLAQGETYTLTIEIWNELENPAEDVTIEIRDELDEHQFFFSGEVIAGPTNSSENALMTQAYGDEDSNGFPVGLTNTITADTAGTGELTLMLRHMPPVNGNAIKLENLAEIARDSGFDALPGSTDISVVFEVTVQ